MEDWTPPKDDMYFQYQCQIINDGIKPLFCEHCMETVLPNGLTKELHAVYTVYMGLKGIIPPDRAMKELQQVFDLDDSGIATVAIQVDNVIIPKLIDLQKLDHKEYLNPSIRSCFNGWSWN